MELLLENVLNEDVLETHAAILWVWHEPKRIWTFIQGLPSDDELISEFESQCVFRKWFLLIVIRLQTSHGQLCNYNNEVSQAKFVTVLLVIGVDFESLDAFSEAFVVWVLEVDTSIGASG